MRLALLTLAVVGGTVLLVFSIEGNWQIAESTFLSGERAPRRDFDWPPKLNEPYPDLQLIDQEGAPTRLSDFKGRIILLEPIGMTCKACQASAR